MAVSNEHLERAHTLAARIAAEFGEKFLPVFEILDAEYERRRVLDEKIRRTHQITSSPQRREQHRILRTSLSVQDAQSSKAPRDGRPGIHHPHI